MFKIEVLPERLNIDVLLNGQSIIPLLETSSIGHQRASVATTAACDCTEVHLV